MKGTSRTKNKRVRAAFIEKEKDMAENSCRSKVDQQGFLVKRIDDYIGSGVFTTKTFREGQYLLEYQGDLVPYKEGRRRDILYEGTDVGSFIYFFRHKGKSWCVDATNNIFGAGRMVNDAAPGEPEENVSLQLVEVDGRPHLCMFALRDLKIGEELRYDYGISDLPWRKQVRSRAIDNDKKTEKSRTCQKRKLQETTTNPNQYLGKEALYQSSLHPEGEGKSRPIETTKRKRKRKDSFLIEHTKTIAEVTNDPEGFQSTSLDVILTDPVSKTPQNNFHMKTSGISNKPCISRGDIGSSETDFNEDLVSSGNEWVPPTDGYESTDSEIIPIFEVTTWPRITVQQVPVRSQKTSPDTCIAMPKEVESALPQITNQQAPMQSQKASPDVIDNTCIEMPKEVESALPQITIKQAPVRSQKDFPDTSVQITKEAECTFPQTNTQQTPLQSQKDSPDPICVQIQ